MPHCRWTVDNSAAITVCSDASCRPPTLFPLIILVPTSASHAGRAQAKQQHPAIQLGYALRHQLGYALQHVRWQQQKASDIGWGAARCELGTQILDVGTVLPKQAAQRRHVGSGQRARLAGPAER